MAKFCAWCGKQIGDDDVFCGFCGKRADGAAAPTPPAQTPPAQTPTAPPQRPAAAPPPPTQGAQQQWQSPRPVPPAQQARWPQTQPTPPQTPKPPQTPPQWLSPTPQRKGGKGLIIGIVALVLVLIVGVGGFVWPGFFKGGADAPSQTAATPKPIDAPKASEAPKPIDVPKATDAPAATPAPTPEPTSEPTPEPTEAPYVNPFADVQTSDWYYDAVLWAGKNGIVTGTAFQPAEPATRAQALTFLWRAAGEPAPGLKVSPYADVSDGDWYYAPVLWGFENGLISTAADGQFHADGTLTRAQAITFIARALDGSARSHDRAFADVREGDWYFDTANWALENGVVGRGTTWRFQPDATVTRAQFVTFMHRAFDETAQKADGSAPAQEGFRELGLPADEVDYHGPKPYRTVTQNGTTVTFTASVGDYRVFEVDDAYPDREGYEWRVMSVDVTTTDGDGSQYLQTVLTEDYYNLKLGRDSYVDGGDVDTYTVLYNGELTDYTIWWRVDNDTGKTLRVTWTAQVPKGYDGVVVGFRNRSLQSTRYLNDYYSDGDFALFRMN